MSSINDDTVEEDKKNLISQIKDVDLSHDVKLALQSKSDNKLKDGGMFDKMIDDTDVAVSTHKINAQTRRASDPTEQTQLTPEPIQRRNELDLPKNKRVSQTKSQTDLFASTAKLMLDEDDRKDAAFFGTQQNDEIK